MPQVKHVVLLRLKADIGQNEIDAIFSDLADLKNDISGIIDFSGGPYSSSEGLNKGFTHGFVTTFINEASRDAYLSHPAHEAVKKALIHALDGGLDGVVAFDWLS